MSQFTKGKSVELDQHALNKAAQDHQYVSEITLGIPPSYNGGEVVRAAKSASRQVQKATFINDVRTKLRVSFVNPQAIEDARAIGLAIEDQIIDAELAYVKQKAAKEAAMDPDDVKPAPVGVSSQTQRYSNRPTSSGSHGAD